MATAYPASSTEGAQFNITAFTNEVNRFYKRNLIFADVCTDATGWAIGNPRGYVSIQIPTTTLLTGDAAGTPRDRALTVNTTSITFDSNTDTAVTLTIDQYEYQGTGVMEGENAISGYNILEEYASACAEMLARRMDATKAGLVDDISTNTVGALIADPSEDDLLYAIQLLDDADVAQDNRNWVISNAMWSSLMRMNRLTSIEFVERKPLSNGEIRDLYGIPCRKYNNLDGTNAVGHDNFLGRKNWCVYATAMRPKSRRFDDIDILGEKYAISAVWGDKILRDDSAVWVKGP
jgi:hypothetical protein